PERAPGPAVTRGLLGRRLALVFPLETLHTTGRVHELLLAGEEGMALGADFDPDVRPRRARLDDLPAGACDRRVHVIRMNTHLHGRDPPWKSQGYQRPPKNAKPPGIRTFLGPRLATSECGASPAQSCSGEAGRSMPSGVRRPSEG